MIKTANTKVSGPYDVDGYDDSVADTNEQNMNNVDDIDDMKHNFVLPTGVPIDSKNTLRSYDNDADIHDSNNVLLNPTSTTKPIVKEKVVPLPNSLSK